MMAGAAPKHRLDIMACEPDDVRFVGSDPYFWGALILEGLIQGDGMVDLERHLALDGIFCEITEMTEAGRF